VNDGGFRILEEHRDPNFWRPYYARLTKADFCSFTQN
jgi:hypothetical protein